MNKTQLLQIENNFIGTLNLNSLKLPTHISYVWRSHFILSHENHWVAYSFWIENICKWNSNLFKTLFHLIKWKKSYHLLSRFCIWKEFEFMEIINAKMKVWESPFIPSHLTFKKFRISLNFTQATTPQSNNQSKLFI